MANIFEAIGGEARAARREVERLNRVMPRPAGFAGPAGGTAGMPASIERRLAAIESDQRRIRTAMESPDPLLVTLAGG